MLRLALLLLLTAHAVLAYKYLPYQAHGFNDLDYFTQLLIKGILRSNNGRCRFLQVGSIALGA
jgi:hypothetical protein